MLFLIVKRLRQYDQFHRSSRSPQKKKNVHTETPRALCFDVVVW